MREIYLVRHGKPEFPGGEKRCIGWTDLALSQEGRCQMEALRETLKEKEIEKIYTSPLKRCVESARILSGGTIPVEIVEDMKEIFMGEWENLSFETIRDTYPEEYEERGRDMAVFAPPGGENFVDCQKRARRAFDRVRASSRGNVIFMAHAGINRSLICDLENKRLRDLLEISQNYGGIYTYREAVFDGMIVAAGRSSRMGDFKPLMELEGKTVIGRQMETLRAGGVREIVVVTGNRGEELRAAVEGPGVVCLHNGEYEHTKMFDSVSMGLRYFCEKKQTAEGKSLDGIFFLPVDVPLFTGFTVEYEKWRFAQNDGDVYCPYYGGAPGHPLLIRASALEALLAHDGERGLKGAYERLGDRVIHLDVPDQGTVMDMDTRKDFERLSVYERGRTAPDEETCLQLLRWFQVDEQRIRHCQAVSRLAKEIAGTCNRQGAKLSLDVVEAGGLLHDLAKDQPDHARTGGKWLRLLGYEKVAEVVEDHMDLPKEKLTGLSESLAVYLADKMIQGETRVSVAQRFEAKRCLFAKDPTALAAVEERYKTAKCAQRLARQGGYTDETD